MIPGSIMPSRPGASLRRGLTGTLATLVAVPLAAAALTTPARAADAVVCRGVSVVYHTDADGVLYRSPLASPGTTAAKLPANGVKIGTGWKGVGKILGGPDGRIYGINANGLWRYRYNGTSFDLVDGKIAQHINTSFTGYATAAFQDKITVDERGDFYLIDSVGKLRWYRYDEETRTWPIFARVLDTGWDRYNLITASTVGTLIARTKDGRIFRHRFDPESQRWIERNKSIGGGWQRFTEGVFSVGGDALFGIQTDGDLFHYRYREDTGTWPVFAKDIDDGWHKAVRVAAGSDACKLNVSHSPARPQTPVTPHSAVAALQSAVPGQAVGDVHYAFSNGIGQLMHARQKPGVWNNTLYTPIGGTDAFTGRANLVEDAAGSVRLLAQNINSELWMRTQASDGLAWGHWTNLAGAMTATPTALRLSDKTLAVFGIGTDGAVWVRPQDGPTGDLLPWHSLGGTGLVGSPTAVALADRSVALFATDGTGRLLNATYRDGELSKGWTPLGGSGFTGRPATVLLPGYFLRVYARQADGTIVTQVTDAAGTFPGSWQPVGDGTLTGVGSPSAVLNPSTGRLLVFSRTTDNQVAFAQETGQGTGTYGEWTHATTNGRPAMSEPTAFTYVSDGGGTEVAFVVRGENSQAIVWALTQGSDGASATRRGAFQPHVLPTASTPAR